MMYFNVANQRQRLISLSELTISILLKVFFQYENFEDSFKVEIKSLHSIKSFLINLIYSVHYGKKELVAVPIQNITFDTSFSDCFLSKSIIHA